MYHALRIEDFSVPVRLGCSPQERAQPQEVRFTIELRFDEAPAGVATDSLDGTVCYADLCQVLRDLAQGREFQLIEKLAADAYRVLREICGAGPRLAVQVHKVRPPIEGLLGGSRYRLGDFQL